MLSYFVQCHGSSDLAAFAAFLRSHRCPFLPTFRFARWHQLLWLQLQSECRVQLGDLTGLDVVTFEAYGGRHRGQPTDCQWLEPADAIQLLGMQVLSDFVEALAVSAQLGEDDGALGGSEPEDGETLSSGSECSDEDANDDGSDLEDFIEKDGNGQQSDNADYRPGCKRSMRA